MIRPLARTARPLARAARRPAGSALPPAGAARPLGLALIVLACLSAPPARALPLYASRERRTCVGCHYDPNGGGMRNDFGFLYEKNRHGLDTEERWASVTVDPRLNEWIAIGLDTRVLYVASHRSGASGLESSTFLPMQGQLNVAVTPHENLTVVMSRGIKVDGGGFDARELYGLIHDLPHDLYAKIGRFRVPFGLRQDDHTSLVRSPDFLPYDAQQDDAGIEVGVAGPVVMAQVSLTDGGAAFTEKAQALSAKLWRGGKALAVGASGYHRFRSIRNAPIPASTFDRWGVFTLGTRGRFTAIGEIAAGTTRTEAGRTVNLGAAFAELDCRVARGLNLRAKVDYLDRDRELGSDLWRRYSAEVDLAPIPFTELKLACRSHLDEVSGDFQEYLAQFYFPF